MLVGSFAGFTAGAVVVVFTGAGVVAFGADAEVTAEVPRFCARIVFVGSTHENVPPILSGDLTTGAGATTWAGVTVTGFTGIVGATGVVGTGVTAFAARFLALSVFVGSTPEKFPVNASAIAVFVIFLDCN